MQRTFATLGSWTSRESRWIWVAKITKELRFSNAVFKVNDTAHGDFQKSSHVTQSAPVKELRHGYVDAKLDLRQQFELDQQNRAVPNLEKVYTRLPRCGQHSKHIGREHLAPKVAIDCSMELNLHSQPPDSPCHV